MGRFKTKQEKDGKQLQKLAKRWTSKWVPVVGSDGKSVMEGRSQKMRQIKVRDRDAK